MLWSEVYRFDYTISPPFPFLLIFFIYDIFNKLRTFITNVDDSRSN